jgi:DNA-binding transcriptional ArsR family regulator
MRQRLVEVRRKIATVCERLQQLRDEEYGLALSLARITGDVAPPSPGGHVTPEPRPARRVRLTPAVRSVLASAEQPLTRNEITEQLLDLGLDASPDAVSASLSYLQRAGGVRNAAGRWYVSGSIPTSE